MDDQLARIITCEGKIDVTGCDDIEITLSDPIGGIGGPVLHVNIKEGNVLRICRIHGVVSFVDNTSRRTKITRKGREKNRAYVISNP